MTLGANEKTTRSTAISPIATDPRWFKRTHLPRSYLSLSSRSNDSKISKCTLRAERRRFLPDRVKPLLFRELWPTGDWQTSPRERSFARNCGRECAGKRPGLTPADPRRGVGLLIACYHLASRRDSQMWTFSSRADNSSAKSGVGSGLPIKPRAWRSGSPASPPR
jgi:hypothetical protein